LPSTKATQNATQVVALSTLAGLPGRSRSCYVLRVQVFDDHWRPLATTGDQWCGCSVRARLRPPPSRPMRPPPSRRQHARLSSHGEARPQLRPSQLRLSWRLPLPLRATILGNRCASAWSARARFPIFLLNRREEPFASVNRVDWNRPQPGAPSASPTADPVPSRMAAEKALARALLRRPDARRCAVGLHPRRVWGHTPNSGAVTFPGSLHRRYPGSTSDLRRRIGCSWRVVATCMYERVRRTCATGARPWGAYSKF